jgi:BolA protein|tara:strand:+ start:1733 stop:2002 length:270 start_codon:yes stop_codon:yes gene_type:complete
MEIEKEIKARLLEKMNLAHFEIKDFTGRHLNHKLHEGGFHLEVVIVSEVFSEKNLVERHRIVYDAMGDLMNHEIHALSMKTLTPKEWEK